MSNRNLHCPQSITTANELIELAAVPNMIISVRECKPIVAIVQDVALGVYRFTKSSVQLTEKQMFNLLANNLKFAGIIPKPAYHQGDIMKWTGRQMLSTIIPKNINIRGPNKSFEETETNKDLENFVVIENGELIQGVVDKTIYQNRTKGIIHSIYNECGPQETRIFFDNTQKLMCDWLVMSGFSVGVSDLIVDDTTNIKLKQMIHDMKVKVYDVIRDIHMGTFENKSINNNSVYFEEEVNKILNQTISQVGKVALSTLNDLYNRMINMVKAGSKGSIINVSQMVACLGQQNVDGKRIPYGFEDRTLPHYTKYDDGPESRGFVENSFMTGLTPQQFFFHAMGGREGLIDTAVKSVTGDTPIIIIEDGKSKYVKIGEWIDSHMDSKYGKTEKKLYPEDRNMEFLKLDKKVYIPTCDEKGNTSWGEMTAVTRHDPGERLYEVTTLGGRKVIAAESKTLLIWDFDKKIFEPKNSKEVKIGDFVPVNAYIPDPPVIIDYVDMTQYFPKTKYLYGTDFNKAVSMMKEAQGNKFQIPRGWWEKHNGYSFITPYPSKARLQRVTIRSNTENIKDGCVYPFAADRECACIPDKFVLNFENGAFIGLYLADGNTDSPAGSIQISKKDESVQDFVRQYFDKMKITHRTIAQQKKRGISYGVIGSSTLLEIFLDKFVGVGAKNKYVPDIAFTAPLDFVKGILSGYFSGDGSIDKYSITASSSSPRLIEGISQLCTRIGIFGKITVRKQNTTNLDMDINDIAASNTISIRSHWGAKFASSINLIMKEKQDKLNNAKFTESHFNFNYENDVVLDSIVEINVIGVDKYPKLYDVTVPSTLNFVLGNGLELNDTSETGYIQRKLVKAMEDCKINYDYTVRNASGSIIQFLYGEDGMDATKIEAQPILYIEMDYAKLKKEYHFTKNDNVEYLLDDAIIKELHATKDWEDKMNKHFDQVLQDREFMIKDIFNSIKDTSIMYPISFMRIINNAKALYNKYEKENLSDLSPLYVLDTINKVADELYINKNNPGNKFIGILIRCYLSPKRVLYNYKFSKMAFDNIIQQVRLKFYDAIAHPSEMVGVIAAQSIGEP